MMRIDDYNGVMFEPWMTDTYISSGYVVATAFSPVCLCIAYMISCQV
jgi:hypothetical protein